MHQKEGKSNKLIFYLFLLILFSSINNKIINEKKNSLLKIDEIKVIGLSKEENNKLSNEFKKFFFQNILLISENTFKNILNENSLVQSFSVKKKYPNSIQINIKKADLLAITNFNNKKYFIGSNGKLIQYYNLENQKKLPFVFGKIDYNNFVNFKKIIDESDFDYKNIEKIYYFPNNRWDIKTKNNILIKLPEKNYLSALNFANNIFYNKNFENMKIIDLRISNQLIITNE
tara:strand:+ start:144 stop:836 length:693 start_codon:yes stop_codon:yes gene_type:complete